MIQRSSIQSVLAVMGLVTVAFAGSACGGSGKGAGAGEALAADGKTCSPKLVTDFQQVVPQTQQETPEQRKQWLQVMRTNIAAFADKYKGVTCVTPDTQESVNVSDKCQALLNQIDKELAKLNGAGAAGGNPFGG